MQCPKCGTPLLRPNQKFCAKCGEKIVAEPQQQVTSSLANVCPSCGASLIPGQKFCKKCGSKIVAPQSPQDNNKGFIDNITHFGTFIRRGTSGVQAEVRREERQRLEQQAQTLGLEVTKPQSNRSNNQQTQVRQQPQERHLEIDTNSIEGVNLVGGRAIWDIHKGEVARLITETEFANAKGLKGVIVQEGCTAMVFIDGHFVTLMQAGVYTFPTKTEAEILLEQQQRKFDSETKELEKQRKALAEEQRKKDEEYANSFATRGVMGEVGAFFRGVGNFIFGSKKEETPEQHKHRVERTHQKVKAIPSPKICRVYIVSNRVINLIFGSQEIADGTIDFAPITIPTKLVDINIAVTMQLEVSNMQEFVKNYLADRKSVSILDFQQMLMPGVKTMLQQLLRNFEYQQEGLPEPIVTHLKAKLQTACNERLQGVEVVRVMDITDNSADFERFRAVERELFASEKELSFLQRTNEFRNRLEQEQNKRTVDAAANAEQLRQSLQSINKDKLLSEDEMEQFVMLLESQKRLREATTKEEEYEALQDLRKNRLVKDDDVAALENTLAQGKIDRENVTEIMRIQASQKVSMAQQIAEFELSDSKLEHDMATALRQAQHQGNLAAAQLDTKRLMDAYNDERNEFDWNRAFSRHQQEDEYNWQKLQREQQANNQQAMFEQQLREQEAQAEHGRQRQDKFDDMDILERKAAIARANMQAMNDAELRQQQEANRSTENLAAMKHNEQMNRDNKFANMTAEQIRAAQLSHLTSDAQVAMAQSYGSEKENELLRQQHSDAKEREANARADRKADMDRMERMFDKMGERMVGMSQNLMGAQQQRADEYRQQAQYAQQRQDHASDQALNALGGFAGAAASNMGAFNGGFNGSAQQTSAMQQSVQTQYQPQQLPAQQPSVQQSYGRICPSCGAEVSEDEMFCGECGQKM